MSTGASEGMGMISMYITQQNNEKNRKQQEEISNRQMAMQEGQFNLTREDTAPYRRLGTASAGTMEDLMGYNGIEAQQNAYSKFKDSPDYQYGYTQANQALERSSLAKGDIFSGNFATRSNELNQGMATQNLGNYYNRLYAGMNAGQGSVNTAIDAGQANVNAQTGILSNLGNMYQNYYMTDAAAQSRQASLIGSNIQSSSDSVVNMAASYYGGSYSGISDKKGKNGGGGSNYGSGGNWGGNYTNAYSGY